MTSCEIPYAIEVKRAYFGRSSCFGLEKCCPDISDDRNETNFNVDYLATIEMKCNGKFDCDSLYAPEDHSGDKDYVEVFYVCKKGKGIVI